jgi:branched-chain amino acid transport system substrate-binding protein
MTGALASLGPGQVAAVKAATREVNAAGGVLGERVTLYVEDSGDISTDTASVSVHNLLGRHVGAIVPGAASAGTESVIDIIIRAGVVMLSPTNTLSTLTRYADHGLYWRDIAPDQVQGRVLGELALAEGARTLAILWGGETYGDVISANAKRAFIAGGGASATTIPYEVTAASMRQGVARLKAQDPDAVVVVGFEDKQIIAEMLSQGLLPLRRSGKRVYFSDTGVGDFSKDFRRGALLGAEGVIPGAQASASLVAELQRTNPGLAEVFYAPEAYDAVVLLALAAEQARSGRGPDVAGRLREVSSEGVPCTSFAVCKRLIDAGRDVDYDGVSGRVEFDADGDPAIATVGVYRYDDTNNVRAVAYRRNLS